MEDTVINHLIASLSTFNWEDLNKTGAIDKSPRNVAKLIELLFRGLIEFKDWRGSLQWVIFDFRTIEWVAIPESRIETITKDLLLRFFIKIKDDTSKKIYGGAKHHEDSQPEIQAYKRQIIDDFVANLDQASFIKECLAIVVKRSI